MNRIPLKSIPFCTVLGLAVLVGCDDAPSRLKEPIQDTVALDRDTREFLDELQHRTFNWFWETTDPRTGLVHDRYPANTFSSIAAIGFGLPTYGIGVERGYVSRADAAERTLTTLRFLYGLPQGPQQTGTGGYKGFFYHFLEYKNGLRFRTNELSTIDTSLLMGGVLFAREYFNADTDNERAIRAYADSLYQRVEWDWFAEGDDARPRMGWYPALGFGRATWKGYNEAMILYILGLGSPTFPLDATLWDEWTSTYEWADYYGYEHVNFEPLFGHQYSHLFVDFRGIQDTFLREKSAELGVPFDYFENSRRATLSQRAYAVDNPMKWVDYGSDVWGLTASDGPANVQREVNGEMRRFQTYSARGVSAQRISDDGTIAPTALGGSIPFAPEVTIPSLRAMVARYGDKLWTNYGFVDAFNPSFTFQDVTVKQHSAVTDQGWFDGEYLGIDQGPIVVMAENYRSGFVWETLKRSPYIVAGLKRAGFAGGWLDDADGSAYGRLSFARQALPGGSEDTRKLVIVLGSSTAEGVGPKDSDSTWVNRYRAYLESVDPNVDVLNLARGGYTTYRILPEGIRIPDGRPAPDPLRNIDAALARHPEAIIVNMPSNDVASGFTVSEQLRNFGIVYDRAVAAGVQVWITTPQPRDLDDAGRKAQFALKAALEKRYGDHCIDVWTGLGLDDGRQDPRWDAGDNLHYNDAAHAIIFDRIRRATETQLVGDR